MSTERDAFSFFHPLRIRYSEIDAQGVVFHAHYLTFFDAALTEYLRESGFDYEAGLVATGYDFHVVRSVVDYKTPIQKDEEIEIGCRIGKTGNSSVTFSLGIFGKGSGELRASGEIVWVNTDQKTRRPAPVPDEFRRLLEAMDAGKRPSKRRRVP